ncbi:MAG: DUF5689 domain-containing protein, partial [Bacteroidales bacterium]|nr:DUF5689 domain-containing protein [Bacteroidales bacterium]
TFNIGDGVTGIIGAVTEFNGLKQFIPYTSFGTATSTGAAIEPIVITYDEYAADIDAYESRLLRFNELTWASTGTFATNQSYNLTDADENTVVIRTSIYQADYIGEAIPAGRYDIIAVGGNYKGAVQIAPRSLADMISNPVVGNEFDGLADGLGLVVYPNPAVGAFNVKVAAPSVVTIFNALGVKVGVVSVNSEVAVRSLGSGLYLLRAVDANGKVATQRVIVK